MAHGSYGQFCPVAMASEVLCTRWTMLVIRELVCGSKRFNELRRGVPRMSPALLSQRLKELEEAGIVRRVASKDEAGIFEYHLTRAGRELEPIVMAMGFWGQKWVETQASLQNLDPGFEVDLYVTTDLRTMTAIWMGVIGVDQALSDEKLTLTGDRRIAAKIREWLGLSVFATEKKAVNA